MIEMIECLAAIIAVTVTCMWAGRVASVTVMAITTGLGMLVMPPFLSWRVESNVDIAALVFQNLVGFVVASKLPARRYPPLTVADSRTEPVLRRAVKHEYSLARITHSAIELNPDLAERLDEIEVEGELDPIAVSESELKQIVGAVLRLAFSNSKVCGIACVRHGSLPLSELSCSPITSPILAFRMFDVSADLTPKITCRK